MSLWTKRLKQWIHGRFAAGYGVSVIVHAILLIALSLIAMQTRQRELPAIDSRFGDDEFVGLEEINEIIIEPLEPTEAFNPAEAVPIQRSELAPVLAVHDSTGTSDLSKSVGFTMPSGGKAVREGSFTAWTVPDDPKPGQDYLIVVQIDLPKEIRRYRKEDLSGYLEGDDGYETPIGYYRGRGFERKFYGKFDMEAKQFVIKIPGAAEKVKDTLEVESRVLDEKQVLVIEF